MGRTWRPKTRLCVICHEEFELERRGGAQPITCSDECRRRRRNQTLAAWRQRVECPENRHGTITGYNTYSCDCDACRIAEREYIQQRRGQVDRSVK